MREAKIPAFTAFPKLVLLTVPGMLAHLSWGSQLTHLFAAFEKPKYQSNGEEIASGVYKQRTAGAAGQVGKPGVAFYPQSFAEHALPCNG